jgi:hypothetical protein
VATEHPRLRRALLEWPYQRLYEHPQTNCSLAIERTFDGEEGVFFGMFRAPEGQTLGELQRSLLEFKNAPLEEIGFFRRMIRISRFPRPVRRFLWSASLNVSGRARAKRFGTFGVTTLGSQGVEQIHPLSPLTTTLTFGPIDEWGKVTAKIIYDHRTLDGAYVARRLVDVERTLNGVILEELRRGQAFEVLPLSSGTSRVPGPPRTLKPHRPAPAGNAGRGA